MRTISADLVPIGVGLHVERGQAGAIVGRPVLEGVEHRQRLLVAGEIGGLLAGLLLLAPDPEQVVVDLERDPQRPAEPAVARDDLVVVGGQQRPRLDRRRDQGGRLAPDHVEVEVDGHRLVGRGAGDVEVLALAQHHARLVVQAHQPQDLLVREPEVRQPMERDPRQAEDEVARVDRLRHAVDGPQRRAVAPLGVAVLDVVVDEAEVVAELDRGCARQGRSMVARDRGVGEQPEEGAHALAARAVVAVHPQVVADHLVDAGGRRVAVRDDPHDLVLGVREEEREVDIARNGHGPRSVPAPDANVSVKSSLLVGKAATPESSKPVVNAPRPRRRLSTRASAPQGA